MIEKVFRDGRKRKPGTGLKRKKVPKVDTFEIIGGDPDWTLFKPIPR
jgi:hypothetical protein